jgi:CheY-like chemotaxis protein
MAKANEIVLGGDLYRIIKSFSFIDKYQFRELQGYSIGFSHKYPVYIALSKNNNRAGLNTNNIDQLFRSNEISKIKDIEAKQQSSQLLLQDSQQKQQVQQRYSTNIMIVDDEPDTLFTYEWFLSDEGYNVEAFTDPQEALKRFVQLEASSYYQLVLLDIRMPRLNGLQLFNTIKAINPKTKIMLCSALDVAEELTSILPDMKHDHIIKKPVKREYFVSKINSMLKN